jgi:hypothetical protein
VPDQDPPNHVIQTDDLLRLDLDVGGLPLRTAKRLVHVDGRVRHAVAFARSPGAQEHRSDARRHPDGVRRDVGTHELHRVVDRQPSGDFAAGRLDVQADVALGVLALEVKQLGDDQVRDLVIDRRAQEHDALVEKQRVDIPPSLTARTRLNDRWDDRIRIHVLLPPAMLTAGTRAEPTGIPPESRITCWVSHRLRWSDRAEWREP